MQTFCLGKLFPHQIREVMERGLSFKVLDERTVSKILGEHFEYPDRPDGGSPSDWRMVLVVMDVPLAQLIDTELPFMEG